MGKEEGENGCWVGNKQSLPTFKSKKFNPWECGWQQRSYTLPWMYGGQWGAAPQIQCARHMPSQLCLTSLDSLIHFVQPASSMLSLPPRILCPFFGGWPWATRAHFACAHRGPGASFASDRNNSAVWLGLSSELPNGIKAKLSYVEFSLRAHLAWLLPSLVPLPYSPTENHSKQITFILISSYFFWRMQPPIL